MADNVQTGYFILADISGYTSYLAGVELDHAHEILSDLLEIIVDRFKPFLTISKLEGDAVFAYVPTEQMPRGDTLFELIESTYLAFRDRQLAIQRRTTCTCNACRNIPALDLKFIIHHGEFMLQTVRKIVEAIGSDVNLAHRLMKNKVSESTGWKAYALYTEQALVQMKITPEQTHIQIESYEHLGEVKIHCVNLRERYDELTQKRKVFLTPEKAHRVLEFEYVSAPNKVWEWFNDPHKRGQWMHSEIQPILRIGGRLAPGARNHCVHGKDEVVVEDLLDIKPFDYYTVDHRIRGSPGCLRMTFQFIPKADGGTRCLLSIHFRARFMPEQASRLMANQIVEKAIKGTWSFDKIDDLIEKETISS